MLRSTPDRSGCCHDCCRMTTCVCLDAGRVPGCSRSRRIQPDTRPDPGTLVSASKCSTWRTLSSMAESTSPFGRAVAGWTALVAALAGTLTLYINWDKWFTDKNSCSISGKVYTADGPVGGVRIGWSPYASHTVNQPPIVNSENFHQIATTDRDGSFSGDCRGAYDVSDPNRFMVLYFLGDTGGLPCLRYRYTYQYVTNTGTHENVNIPYAGC